MQIEKLPTTLLTAYAGNARIHSDEQVSEIAASIKEFGFTQPVLIDPGNEIIAGHGRVMAARKLANGGTIYRGPDGEPMEPGTVPCIRLSHLTDAQRRAYILADNRIALSSEWSEDLLKAELTKLHDEGFDLGLTGFTDDELEAAIGDATEDADLSDEDEKELPQAIQMQPPKEYCVVMTDSPEEWERLKVALKLTPVRRGGYKQGSMFDAVGTQRVVRAADVLALLTTGTEVKPC